MRVLIDVPESCVEEVVRRAVGSGFKRENPRKAWNDKERKEAVRFYLECKLPA